MTAYPQKHLDNGLSYSAIKTIIDGQPATYKLQYMDSEKTPPTPAMVQGSLLDTLVFEPDKFDERFVVAPKYNGHTKEGKAIKAQLEAESGRKQIIRAGDMANIQAAVLAVQAYPPARVLLNDINRIVQPTYTGIETLSGVKVQAKPDLVVPRKVVDLKSMVNVSPAGATLAMEKFKYDIQAALYQDVLNQNGLGIEECRLICVELRPPYLCAVYRIDSESLDDARVAIRSTCDLFKSCVSSGKWPGYEQSVKTIKPRPFASKERLSMREGE